MIRFENVSKTFRGNGKQVEAVKEVSLHIKKGEIFGIIGYSGAGKSTLVRCINLLERPDRHVTHILKMEAECFMECWTDCHGCR